MSETRAHSLVDLDALKLRLSPLHSRRLLNSIPVWFVCLFVLAFGERSMSPVLLRIALETLDGK